MGTELIYKDRREGADRGVGKAILHIIGKLAN